MAQPVSTANHPLGGLAGRRIRERSGFGLKERVFGRTTTLNGKPSKKKNDTGHTSSPGEPSNAQERSIGSGPMDVDLLQQLVRLMAVNDLNTVDVRDGEKRIILKRGAGGAVIIPTASAGVAHNAPAAAAPAAPPPAAPANADADLKPIKSP